MNEDENELFEELENERAKTKVSSSVEWSIWHLCPNGWQKGSYKNLFDGFCEKAVPKDRLCSYLYQECLDPDWQTKTSQTYRQEGKEAQIKKLIKKYGQSPKVL